MISVRRFLVAVVAALALAAQVPSFAHAELYAYHWQSNIAAGGSEYGERHNHWYNEMIVNNQGFLTNIHESTFCCGNKWAMNGIGSVWLSHADTWYAMAICHNRGSFSYWVPWCQAEWG